MEWTPWKEQAPPLNEEVNAFHGSWVNKYNPTGVRVGVLTERQTMEGLKHCFVSSVLINGHTYEREVCCESGHYVHHYLPTFWAPKLSPPKQD